MEARLAMKKSFTNVIDYTLYPHKIDFCGFYLLQIVIIVNLNDVN